MPPKPDRKPLTFAHVTHEAVEQLGGIGTVLEGLMISPVYQKHVGRSILVGPTATHMSTDPEHRLGDHGKVLYSSIDNIDRGGFSGKFKPIEWAFNVAIVYGTRHYDGGGEGRSGESEVLLIDVFRVNPDRLNVFKLRLWETFGLDSGRYEKNWDYEEYVRLAEPAFYALSAMLNDDELPCVLFSHEFMGMPAALKAILDGQKKFHTVFHAHECATARRIVEDHPGHDTMFYNVLDQAMDDGLYVEDVFGSMDALFRHALVGRSHLCDGVIAVGDRTRDELQFLNSKFDDHPIDLVYNGVPAMKVTPAQKNASRKMLLDYSQALVGYCPDVLMTHVTRPVISKGLWRDMKVCHALDERLSAQGKTGILYILTSGGGARRPQDVAAMEEHYGWPRVHKPGYPDLVGPESDIHNDAELFNADHEAVQIVLVNQFGWSRSRIGKRLPEKMDFADLRRATDVEFGMATYEPFGISPLEPLGSGALCVISNVCGCQGFVNHVTHGHGSHNVIVADFTRLDRPRTIEELKKMTREDRNAIEEAVARGVADQIMDRLPWDEERQHKLLHAGQALVARMGWDQVIAESLLPMLERLRNLPAVNGNGGAKK
ncbi:MAG: hypothetical protein K8S99_06730 [Planctomycetes bacterium]|nr:hypothetical protein [Planctomycetota bacterium]